MSQPVDLLCLSNELEALKVILGGGKKHSDDVIAALHDHPTELATAMIDTPSSTLVELQAKAAVLIDWIVPEDLPGMLAKSLCSVTGHAVWHGVAEFRCELRLGPASATAARLPGLDDGSRRAAQFWNTSAQSGCFLRSAFTNGHST